VQPWNTFVEGDNLDVLARLATTFRQFDVVYLDPPYNTGNPFVYDDKVDGRRADRHLVWASMMRPRLEAVRAVLGARGAVFVSIDDNEVAQLRLLMDEVFGEDAFIAQIVVNLNAKGRQLGRGFATSHEYLLVYARSMVDCASGALQSPSQLVINCARNQPMPLGSGTGWSGSKSHSMAQSRYGTSGLPILSRVACQAARSPPSSAARLPLWAMSMPSRA